MSQLKTYIAAASILCVSSGAVLLGQRGSAGSTVPSAASTIPPPGSGRSNFPMGAGNDPMMTTPGGFPDPLASRTAALQEKTRNTERQKKIESDTTKLLGLVTDLKSQVDGDKTLSSDELGKRAEEIEKLARSVKDKMKG